MATFTIKTTITGTVGGRSIDVSNTYTVPDVIQVVEEADEMPDRYLASGDYVTMNAQANIERRGLMQHSGPALYAVQVGNPGGLMRLGHGFGVSDMAFSVHLGGIPTVFHYSDQFQGHVGQDGGPSIPDPDGNLTRLSVQTSTSILFRAFALLKPVS